MALELFLRTARIGAFENFVDAGNLVFYGDRLNIPGGGPSPPALFPLFSTFIPHIRPVTTIQGGLTLYPQRLGTVEFC